MKPALFMALLLVFATISLSACFENEGSGEEGNKAPNAVIKTQGNFMTGKQIWFDASQSTDPNGDRIVEYYWDFDDGAIWPTPKDRVPHIYQYQGVYEVTLIVKDEGGLTGSTTVELDIKESPNRRPEARADGDEIIFLENGTATGQFDASDSYDNNQEDVLQYFWDFNASEDLNNDSIGDNDRQAEGEFIDWDFTVWGDYTVTLTVTDGELNDTNSHELMVRDPTPEANMVKEDPGFPNYEYELYNVSRSVPIADVNYFIIRNGSTVHTSSLNDSSGGVNYRDDDLDNLFSLLDNINLGTGSDTQDGDTFLLTYGPNENPRRLYGGEAAEIDRVILE